MAQIRRRSRLVQVSIKDKINMTSKHPQDGLVSIFHKHRRVFINRRHRKEMSRQYDDVTQASLYRLDRLMQQYAEYRGAADTTGGRAYFWYGK